MKIKLICRQNRANSKGLATLYIRFTHERKSRFVSTGLSIDPCYWDSEAQILTSDCPDRQLIQREIDAKTEPYFKKLRQLEVLELDVTFDNLLDSKAKGARCTLAGYLERTIADMESAGKFGVASKHKSLLSLLAQFRDTSIRFEQIDVSYLMAFEAFLRKRGNSNNSIATKLSLLKAMYNKAINESPFKAQNNPFKQYKVGSLWTTTRKRAITKEDAQKIILLDIPRNYRSSYKSFARDIFLFSYLTAGINFGDMARLKTTDIVNGRLYYRRHKTNKLINCKLTPLAVEILEKYHNDAGTYVFPILDTSRHITERQIFDRIHKALTKVNRELKAIGKEIGLKFPLTTYTARHTYATVLKRSGVNVALISESLGHSDITTTQIYLDSFENSQIDEAMKNLL